MNITLLNIEFHLFELPLLVFLSIAFINIIISEGLVIKLCTSKPLSLFLFGFSLFLTAIIASSLFAIKPIITVKAFLKWTEVLLLTLLVFFYIRDQKSFKKIYWLLFASMFGYSIISLYWLLTGRLAEYGFRMPGGYDSLFALSLIIPFIKKKTLIFYLVSIIVITNIFFSFSRGAWLGLILLLAYLMKYFYTQNRKRTIIGLVLMSVVFIAVTSENITELISWRWNTSFDAENASNIERTGLLRVAFQAFLSSPLFGIGALNYPIFLKNTSDLYIMRAEVLDTLTPHNFFLEVLSELGLFGFTALVILLYSINLAVSNRDHTENSFKDLHFREGLLLLFFTFLYSVSLGFISGGYRFYMALLFGMALSLTRIGESE